MGYSKEKIELEPEDVSEFLIKTLVPSIRRNYKISEEPALESSFRCAAEIVGAIEFLECRVERLSDKFSWAQCQSIIGEALRHRRGHLRVFFLSGMVLEKSERDAIPSEESKEVVENFLECAKGSSEFTGLTFKSSEMATDEDFLIYDLEPFDADEMIKVENYL